MKFYINTLVFILLFFLFKEITYYIFEIIGIREDQIFIGEPKDMLLMQIGVFIFAIFMIFLFYFLESYLKKILKKGVFRKIVIFIFLLFFQTIVISITFLFKTRNIINVYSKTYLIVLGVSALVIIFFISILIIIQARWFPVSSLKQD